MASTRAGVAAIVAAALIATGGVMLDAAHAHRGVFAHAAMGEPAPQGGLALDAPIPEKVPAGVELTIGDPMTQHVLEHTGWIRELPFRIRWAQIAGGPAVTEAFHARALDVGLAADIPPIHATWVGIPVKIIAVRLRKDPERHPAFVLAVAPGSGIRTLADLRGRRIAFSPGQVQGEIVLRSLEAAHLTRRDVTLVELPSTGADLYLNALVGRVVDAAPIGAGAAAWRYAEAYGGQGARLIPHGPTRDDLVYLYVRTEILRDPGKAAALRAYVRIWARASDWIARHPDEWARIYYEQNQGLGAAEAHAMVEAAGQPDIPRRWDEAIAAEQGAIDLMARETHRAPFAAAGLFDRRFEAVAANTVAANTVPRAR
ncbi:MAG TPA: ABC transporter substrate-binding protein [Caulobacteraceae bacterium]|nr:ABC transporter substrate-binding protein [Caulobacteraceae bacterium]